jgi:hypothetical protein
MNGARRPCGHARRWGAVPVVVYFWMSRWLPRWAIGRLVTALDCGDEEASMAAYEALVRIGSRGIDFLVDEVLRGRSVVAVLQILGDIGDSGAIPHLEAFARSDDPNVAAVAQESIALVERHADRREQEPDG